MHSVSSRNGWLPSRLVLFLLSLLRNPLLVSEYYDNGRDVLQVSGNVTTFPSTAAIVAEPLGITLVISAWNFPFCTYTSSSFCSFSWRSVFAMNGRWSKVTSEINALLP